MSRRETRSEPRQARTKQSQATVCQRVGTLCQHVDSTHTGSPQRETRWWSDLEHAENALKYTKGAWYAFLPSSVRSQSVTAAQAITITYSQKILVGLKRKTRAIQQIVAGGPRRIFGETSTCPIQLPEPSRPQRAKQVLLIRATSKMFL